MCVRYNIHIIYNMRLILYIICIYIICVCMCVCVRYNIHITCLIDTHGYAVHIYILYIHNIVYGISVCIICVYTRRASLRSSEYVYHMYIHLSKHAYGEFLSGAVSFPYEYVCICGALSICMI